MTHHHTVHHSAQARPDLHLRDLKGVYGLPLDAIDLRQEALIDGLLDGVRRSAGNPYVDPKLAYSVHQHTHDTQNWLVQLAEQQDAEARPALWLADVHDQIMVARRHDNGEVFGEPYSLNNRLLYQHDHALNARVAALEPAVNVYANRLAYLQAVLEHHGAQGEYPTVAQIAEARDALRGLPPPEFVAGVEAFLRDAPVDVRATLDRHLSHLDEDARSALATDIEQRTARCVEQFERFEALEDYNSLTVRVTETAAGNREAVALSGQENAAPRTRLSSEMLFAELRRIEKSMGALCAHAYDPVNGRPLTEEEQAYRTAATARTLAFGYQQALQALDNVPPVVNPPVTAQRAAENNDYRANHTDAQIRGVRVALTDQLHKALVNPARNGTTPLLTDQLRLRYAAALDAVEQGWRPASGEVLCAMHPLPVPVLEAARRLDDAAVNLAFKGLHLAEEERIARLGDARVAA